LYGLSAFARSLESFYALVVAAKKMQPLIFHDENETDLSSIIHPPIEAQIELKLQANDLEQVYIIKEGDTIVLRGQDGASRRKVLWALAGSKKEKGLNIFLADIDWNLIPMKWKCEEVLLIDRPTTFDLNLADNILLKRKGNQTSSPLPSFNELPGFLVKIYENLASGNALNWADDPRTRLYITLFRTLITDSRIVLIDSLFDELSPQQQREFINFFRKSFHKKILVVNSCVQNKDIYWSQEVKWKTD
jgi:hypothetical protein